MFNVQLYDLLNDGWNGGSLDVQVNGVTVQNVTLPNGGGPGVYYFATDSGDVVDIIYNAGTNPSDNYYYVLNEQFEQVGIGLAQNFGDNPNNVTNLLACSSCPKPTQFEPSILSTSQAVLDWLPGSNAESWEIEWGLAGFAQGTGTLESNITTTPYQLSGLANATLP